MQPNEIKATKGPHWKRMYGGSTAHLIVVMDAHDRNPRTVCGSTLWSVQDATATNKRCKKCEAYV